MLNDITLLVIAAVMLGNRIFGKATAYAGVAAGVLISVPSSAGTFGTYMALAPLLPWVNFSVLVARRLFGLGKDIPTGEAGQKGKPGDGSAGVNLRQLSGDVPIYKDTSQIFLISGCSGGIGRDLARRLALSGYSDVAAAGLFCRCPRRTGKTVRKYGS